MEEIITKNKLPEDLCFSNMMVFYLLRVDGWMGGWVNE